MPALFLVVVLRRIVNSQRFQAAIETAMRREPGDPDSGSDEAGLTAGSSGMSRVGLMARTLFALLALAAIGWIAAQLVARRMTIGDEGSDEFQVAVIMGGKESRSVAGQLRSASAITVMGGLLLDLREASLDPAGAELELSTTIGGLEVRVPPSWRVEVEQTTVGGVLELDLPLDEEVPEDAPTLRIRATTRLGSGLVTARRG